MCIRDSYEGDRLGFNPTLRMKLSSDTTLDLSYEHIDHERFIDRGIPTANNVPIKDFAGIVFGDKDNNIHTVEASVFRAIVSSLTKLPERIKLSLSVGS